MKFIDAYNPTHEELRRWSSRGDNLWPNQDFDLMITNQSNIDLILELASDELCRKREFFLRCLYLFVGDKVRSSLDAQERKTIELLLSRAQGSTSQSIRIWIDQVHALVENTQSFDYQDWCNGRLARKNWESVNRK